MKSLQESTANLSQREREHEQNGEKNECNQAQAQNPNRSNYRMTGKPEKKKQRSKERK